MAFWHFVPGFRLTPWQEEGAVAVFHDEVQHFLVAGLDRENLVEFQQRASMSSSFGPQGVELPRLDAEQDHLQAHGLGWGDCPSCKTVFGVN